MKRWARILIVALFGMLSITPARCVAPATLITQYGHAVWHLEDGLSNAEPQAITQTSDGYIWIGTETGLLRSDGVRFVQWTPQRWEDISDHEVDVLYAASDGALWIGTPTNLAVWKNGILTVIDTVGPVYVNKIVEDREHRIWFATSRRSDRKSLCQVLDATARCFGAAEGIPLATGKSLVVNADGSFGLISDDILINWIPDKLQTAYPVPSSKASVDVEGVSSLENEVDGSRLIGFMGAGRGRGLERLAGSSWLPYKKPGFDGSTLGIQTIYTDREGTIWIGTRSDGLYKIDGEAVDHYERHAGLSGNSVRDIYEDHEGNLWVATDGGVDCFRDLKAVLWSTDQGLPAGHVRSVLATRDGGILVGIDHTLNLLHKGGISSISAAPGMPDGLVAGMVEDRNGRYWVGVGNELAIYDGLRFSTLKRPDGKPIGNVFSLTLASDGSVWALVYNKALPREILRFDDGKMVESMGVRGFGLKVVSDQASGVWVNGQGRIGHYVNGKLDWVSLVGQTDAKNFSVQDDLVVSTTGVVFASSRLGLWVVRQGQAKLVGGTAGLPCQNINGLLLTGDNSLWMRSSCGLIEVDSAALDSWWLHSDRKMPYKIIDSSQGARPSRTVFFPQMSLAPDGRLWVGNDSGVQSVDPSHLPFNTLPPPIHIETVVADRDSLTPINGLKIRPLVRELEVRYTALSLSSPRQVIFKYRLEGKDADWQDPGSRRSAFYSDLKPGRYRFHVVGANNDGVWNNSGDSLDFEIRPAWFQAFWLKLVALTLGMGFIWTLYQWRVKSIADAISGRFNERLDERTRLAREIHDTFLQTVQGSKMVADNALNPGTSEARMRSALEGLSVWLEQAVTEGRAAVQALRASTKEQDELGQSINSVLQEYCHDPSMSATLAVTGDPRVLHPIVRDEISLVAREAIRNAFVHSRATELRIEIQFSDEFRLVIKDNGVGIDPDVVNSGKVGHFGLLTMRERSARIHAKIDIQSRRNRGTEVSLSVPGKAAYAQARRKSMFGPRSSDRSPEQ
jgi:signal transduction histidine kinase/ligand-binding sensor domain-containing protein